MRSQWILSRDCCCQVPLPRPLQLFAKKVGNVKHNTVLHEPCLSFYLEARLFWSYIKPIFSGWDGCLWGGLRPHQVQFCHEIANAQNLKNLKVHHLKWHIPGNNNYPLIFFKLILFFSTDKSAGRRGLCGTMFVFKIAGPFPTMIAIIMPSTICFVIKISISSHTLCFDFCNMLLWLKAHAKHLNRSNGRAGKNFGRDFVNSQGGQIRE